MDYRKDDSAKREWTKPEVTELDLGIDAVETNPGPFLEGFATSSS